MFRSPENEKLIFQDIPGQKAKIQDFPGLEIEFPNFQDFPGFPGPVRTLIVPRNYRIQI